MKKTPTVLDDSVFVYTNPSTIQVHSIFANFIIYLEDGKHVAFDEYNEILCYGNDSYHYTAEQFNKISSIVDYKEMSYQEYLREHQDLLKRLYPDAPVIAQIDENAQAASRANPILQNLTNLGLNVKFSR